MFPNRNQYTRYTRYTSPETRWDREQRIAREKEFWNSKQGKFALLVAMLMVAYAILGIAQVLSHL